VADGWEDLPAQKWEDLAPTAKPSTVVQRVGSGMADPIHGGAQTLTHILPTSVVNAGNRFNNWLADVGVPLAKIPEGGVDQMVREREAEYNAQRAAAGSTGFDWARFGGNVASPANFAIAGRLPGAASSLGARVAGNAAGGVALSALNPVTSGDSFWGEKAWQAGMGATIGGALPVVGEGIAKVVRPKVDAAAKWLLDQGVKLTPGQILGGAWQKIEDSLTSVPFLGDSIKSAQRRGIESFDAVVINRSLEPIGEKLPSGIKGHEAVSYAVDKLGSAYEKLLPKMKGDLYEVGNQLALPAYAGQAAKPSLAGDLQSIRQLGQNLPEKQRDQLDRILRDEIEARFTTQGKADGQTIKEIESKLGEMVRRFGKSEDYDVNRLGDAVQAAQKSLRDMVSRVNPGFAEELKKINEGYAHLLRAQTAAARVGAQEGIFTPNQFKSAVREMDPSKRHRAFATGEALDQDLANAAASRLSQTVPDSGTVGRSMVNVGLGAGIGGAVSPMIPLSLLAASAPYTAPGIALSKLALTSRPQGAGAAADSVRNYLPFLTPGLVASGNVTDR